MRPGSRRDVAVVKAVVEASEAASSWLFDGTIMKCVGSEPLLFLLSDGTGDQGGWV